VYSNNLLLTEEIHTLQISQHLLTTER